MIGGDEIKVDLVDQRSLVAHSTVGCLDLRAGIGKKFSRYGTGSRHGNNAGLFCNGCLYRFNMLLDLVVTLEIDDQHLVFPEPEIVMADKRQLIVYDDRPGDENDRNGELKDDQHLPQRYAVAGWIKFTL